MHYIWQHKLWLQSEMKTVDGRRVEVIYLDLPVLPRPGQAKAVARKGNIFNETLHYADAAAAGAPRYDGKISVRNCDNALTAYAYDCHGRLITSTSCSYRGGAASADFSTEYAYDRNANLLNVTRNGIIDNVRGIRSYGINNDISMTYSVNRLKSATVEAAGADYEGRTGLPQFQSSGVDFTYDSNGNMTSDAVRGITDIRYNRLNLPVRLTFADGHRQTIAYDGFGRKTRVDYAQGPETVFGGDLPADGDYGLTSSRVYAGPHVFADGQLEYSAFDGGYFNADGSPCYYITDWQGNNAAVVNSAGSIIQSATYYPYGEPTVEPKGQRYLFAGKEREHAGGRNAYDFGARSLTPYGSWPSPDLKAEDFYQISPFVYCGGDPINRIDRDGRWTVYLANDKNLNKNASRYPHDSKINVFAHGNDEYISYSKRGKEIKSGEQLKDAIIENLYASERLLSQPAVEIVLHSCDTGATPKDNSDPIGKIISKDIPNAIIKAPNGKLKIDKYGKEKVYDENEKQRSPENSWNYYFRGLKISPLFVEIIKIYLMYEDKKIEERYDIDLEAGDAYNDYNKGFYR